MRTAVGIAVLAALGVGAGGCGLFQRRPALPPIVVLEAPILLAPPNPSPMLPPAVLAPPLDSPADSLPDFADSLAVAAALPPPPRRASAPERPAPGDERPPMPAAAAADGPPPQLTTGLSPAQASEARQRTLNLLSQTDRALLTLNARRLNAEDSATRAQAGEYVRQARQALAQGDVVRAENLADKADTLARFLLGR